MADDLSKLWQQVLADSERIKGTSLKDLFDGDDARAKGMTKTLSDGESEIVVDFSKQLVDAQALKTLMSLAVQAGVIARFTEMCNGERVNFTENQAALHTALRSARTAKLELDGQDIIKQVHEELDKIQNFSATVRSEKKFKKIVNIGIGGSDLGPALIYDALSASRKPEIDCLFVANIDSTELNAALAQCQPQETLFIVCSKSFKTAETLANARIAKQWLATGLGVGLESEVIAEHFVVVSANTSQARTSGVNANHSFQIWPWVGGRYSIASAMSLASIIAFGFETFKEFLAGMRSVDEQMQTSKPEDNITLILGLIDVFNFGTRRHSSQAVLPYASALRLLPSYLQQLIMESNGKSIRQDGSQVDIATSPVVWGGVGTNSQHAFMQMLHQGTQVVPVDFIGFAQLANADLVSHDALVANMFAQAKALAFGENQADKNNSAIAEHRKMSGNRPSTTLLAKSLTPRTLGALIAMYEHRVFVHGIIAQINSFDQWGVELGKTLSVEINQQINQNTAAVNDASTKSLIDKYRQMRRKS
ncbi:MAG: glucose-6-phosphate isomerase [Actinomycetota bacterium]|nr:glucose-6-phosphate isomerase [Actinomycetota bacterium]